MNCITQSLRLIELPPAGEQKKTSYDSMLTQTQTATTYVIKNLIKNSVCTD